MSVSLFGSAKNEGSSATWDVTLPASINAGDIIDIHVQLVATDTINAASGFTAHAITRNGSRTMYKIAAGTEGGTNISGTISASGAWTAIASVYRATSGTMAFDVYDHNLNSTTTSIVCPSVTAANANSVLVCSCGMFTDVTITEPGSMTLAQEDETGGPASVAYELVGAGATGTRTFTLGAARTSRGHSRIYYEVPKTGHIRLPLMGVG